MPDIGPTWLRTELPHPIAKAWHFVELAPSIDGVAAASAVEVALRCVTAIQLANLLAEGGPLPELLENGKFKRPTLGSWRLLALTLRASIARPFVLDLVTWPHAEAEAALERLVHARNRLAHAGQMSPRARSDAASALAEDAASVLVSLAWLRQVELFTIAEARPRGGSEVHGRIQFFRGTEPHPEARRACWIGAARPERVYLGARDHGGLLDLEPFLHLGRLRHAKVEALCLWKGLGERGAVLLSDDPQELVEFVPLDRTAPRLVPHDWRPTATSAGDATRPERPVLTPPTEVLTAPPSEAVAPPPRRPRRPRRRWYLALAAFIATLGAAAAIALVAGGDDCKTDPALAGTWRFDTVVQHARSGAEAGLGVRGHYVINLDLPRGCAFPALLRKTGYTEKGILQRGELAQHLGFAIAPGGRSISALARLTRRPGDTTSADIALRLMRFGHVLAGLWRHEGEDWARAGYSGALLGHREGSAPPALRTACFYTCVAGCHDGGDPLGPAAETCLEDCARRLADCDR